MSRVIFDEPAWWRRPGWQIAAAAVLTLVSLPIWWAALAPVDHEPVALHTPVAPPTVVRPTFGPAAVEPIAPAPAPLPAAASPTAASPAPSTMVAPGVHLTPLSVPPGTVPVPAGLRDSDSEPEN